MIQGWGGLETKFRRFDGELGLKDGAVIAGYASLFGAEDQGGDVVEKIKAIPMIAIGFNYRF